MSWSVKSQRLPLIQHGSHMQYRTNAHLSLSRFITLTAHRRMNCRSNTSFSLHRQSRYRSSPPPAKTWCKLAVSIFFFSPMEPVLLDAYALLGVEPSATDDEVHTMALTKLKTDLYGDPEGRRFHLLPQNDCHSTKGCYSAAYMRAPGARL